MTSNPHTKGEDGLFIQGYIEALFASAEVQKLRISGVGPTAVFRAPRPSDLAPETRVAILKDCEAYREWVGGTYANDEIHAGALFWELRSLADNAALVSRFPHLTPYLGDDGKIHLRDPSR